MLYFARWKIFGILLVVLAGFVYALPNLFSAETVRANWPSWLPSNQVVLGLDLQGGAYLLYQVDREAYTEKRLKNLLGTVRDSLRSEPRIGYSNLRIGKDGLFVTLRDKTQFEEARRRLEALVRPGFGGLLGERIEPEFSFSMTPEGRGQFILTEEGLESRLRGVVAQSIEVIRRRIDELGTTEASIQRQGIDRILVEAPGITDPERLKGIIGKTAQMTFHLVNEVSAPQDPDGMHGPLGSIAVPDAEIAGITYLLEEIPLLTGDDLVDARAGFDGRTNAPIVNFRFNTSGAQKFAKITQENVGRAFAVVLDNAVITAPQIQEPIPGGSGQISGSFTVAQANDLAVLLRAGALPAQLDIIEERTVGPSLGADSIAAGRTAAVVGFLLVVGFMILCYGTFGVLASLALLVNLVLIIAALSVLRATLTLPGLAGIVLTMGMAVDANVLIYERIREESRAGRSVISAIDSGFKETLGTILDANITTLIAAVILFFVGSGPVRGFAVTLMIGVVTSVFCSFTLTRLMVARWVHLRRRKLIMPI